MSVTGHPGAAATQAARRRHEFDLALAYEVRQATLRRQREAELAVEIAKVRARQCKECFEVRTPANTCNCTEG